MTDLREWQMAFLEQARSDWNAFVKFLRVVSHNYIRYFLAEFEKLFLS